MACGAADAPEGPVYAEAQVLWRQLQRDELQHGWRSGGAAGRAPEEAQQHDGQLTDQEAECSHYSVYEPIISSVERRRLERRWVRAAAATDAAR